MTGPAEDLVPGPAAAPLGPQALELHVEVAHLAQHPAQPAQLGAEAPRPGPGGRRANRSSAARSRLVATRMSWSSSGSSPSRVPGSFWRSTASWRRMTANASSPVVEDGLTSVGPRSGGPGMTRARPRAGRPRTWRGSPAVTRTKPRSSDTSGSSASCHSRRTSTSTRRSCHGPLAAAHHDAGVVERHLGHVDAPDPQRERPPAGAHLEHLAQSARAGDGAQPAAHRPFGAERGHPAVGQDLGHLESLTQAALLGGPRVLQRGLLLTAALAGTEDEPGSRQAPVVGVEVGVDQPPRRPRPAR